MYIPKAPQPIEVAAPKMKAKVVYAPFKESTQIHTIPAMMSTKIAQILYSDAMNSDAPSWMSAPISLIPWGTPSVISCS